MAGAVPHGAARMAQAEECGRAAPAVPAIVVEGIAKTFRRAATVTHALDDISFAVGREEFLAIVGPSGCGKSTLLRLVAGLLAPDRGRIAIGGRTVEGPFPELGIVFQKPILLDWRTVLGNVLLQIELRGLKAADHQPRAPAARCGRPRRVRGPLPMGALGRHAAARRDRARADP
ncbi:MAG: transporter ATP-binding protein [Geminicoccaceae bacterium]|nr:transporter ATP-binding protein [Geminicoccaceae bacterium]